MVTKIIPYGDIDHAHKTCGYYLFPYFCEIFAKVGNSSGAWKSVYFDENAY